MSLPRDGDESFNTRIFLNINDSLTQVHHYSLMESGMAKPIFAWLLLAVGLILAPFAVTAFWLRVTVFNTDRFVATLSPLSTNPAIVESISNEITQELFGKVEVETRVQEALPSGAVFLAPAITAQLQSFVETLAQGVIGSGQFNEIWTQALRFLHPKVLQFISKGEEVALDIRAAVDLVKSELNQRGITIFNDVSSDREIVLFESQRLAQVQWFLSLISGLGIALPIASLVFILAAILISPNRIRFLIWTGIGLILAMIVLLILIAAARQQFIGAVVNFTPEAAAAIYTTLTRFLQRSAFLIAFIGLVLAVGAFFTPKAISRDL